MSLIKNSSIVVTGVIVASVLAYLFHFIAGRVLGPEEYGAFGALMALFFLVALPAGALSFAITKYTARFNTENEIGKIAILRRRIQNDVLAFSVVMLICVAVFSKFIADYLKIDSALPVLIVGITLVFALVLPVNRGILLGMKKFKMYSLNAIIEAASRLVLLAVFLLLGYGVDGSILAYGGAYLIAFIVIFPSIREIHLENKPGLTIEIKPIYRFVFQVLAANIILQSALNLPSLYIKHFYSSEFTGFWTASLNISRISLFITGAISLVMFPEIAGEKDPLVKRKIFYKALLLVFVCTSGVALLLLICPKLIIVTLYGRAYLGAIPILEIMGGAMILFGLFQLRVDYFFAKLK